jgi:phage terminase Nu1 subunit (DNA packaging protein)
MSDSVSATGLMTRTAYARHRGVSHTAVNKAVRDGRCPLVEGTDKIDPAAADAFWPREERVASIGLGAKEAQLVRKERARADIVEIEAGLAKGEIVKVADVRVRWADGMIAFKQRLQGIPGKVEQRFGLGAKRLVEDEINEALRDLSAA